MLDGTRLRMKGMTKEKGKRKNKQSRKGINDIYSTTLIGGHGQVEKKKRFFALFFFFFFFSFLFYR
jgi:hypothetical protein